jgi:DNA (cytosine-5)-methyltransferase 1
VIQTFNKLHRAANNTDYESWGESDVAPTQNVFDVGDIRATTIIVDDGEPPITFNWQNGGGYGNANDGLAITEDGVGPLTTSQTPAVAHKYTVRRLTPTECERLQGFPDGHTEFRADGTRQSDTQRYKQLGNAVTVNVAEYIAALIMHADEHYVVR